MKLNPQSVANACLCLHVRRAARSAVRRYDDAFRSFGITSGQFTLLMLLAADRRIGMQQLADELAMDRTTLTAAIKPLLRDGLVSMHGVDTDRRMRIAILTDAGRRLLIDAMPSWQAAQDQLAQQLSGIDLKKLKDGLKAMA